MRAQTPKTLFAILGLLGSFFASGLPSTTRAQNSSRDTDPLPSWNDGPTKKAVIDFVAKVTTEKGSDFVSPDERIAVFDNDGTLWSEQPIYFQLAFAVDRIKALASQHVSFFCSGLARRRARNHLRWPGTECVCRRGPMACAVGCPFVRGW